MISTNSPTRSTKFTLTLGVIVSTIVFPMSAYAQHALDSLESGRWMEVSNSRMENVDPCPSVSCPPGNTGISGVMVAWSGGTLDVTRNRLLVWGGGHADYSGNEIYAFDIPSMQWVRVSNPSTDVGGNFSSYVYPDGKPRSLHTWGYIEYVPTMDKFVSFGGVAPYPGSGSTGKVFAYDFSSGQWDTNSIPNVPTGGESRGANAVFDSVTGNVWVHTSNSGSARLNKYNPTTNSWTSHSGRPLNYFSVTALDPQRRLLVTVGAGQLYVWDLNDPDAAPYRPTTTGAKFIEGRDGPGFVFDTSIGKFVGWDGGTSVYILDPDTWNWTEQRAVSGNSVSPTSPSPNGTFGRFRYVPAYNAYVLVNNTDENVYFYRLSDVTVVTPNTNTGLQAN